MCEGRGGSQKSEVETPELGTSASRADARKPEPVPYWRLTSGVSGSDRHRLCCQPSRYDSHNGHDTTVSHHDDCNPETWVWGIDSVELGGGYSVGPCEGDADQIACITKDDVVVGSAEFLSLPTESFDFLDGVVDPVESIELIAADYIATFQTDRQSTCPNLEFKTLAEVPVTVAGGGGLRYGFEELDGVQVVEKNLIYGVRIGENINLYSFAAIAEGACLSNEGELSDPAILDALLPGLDRVMALVESG